jgi:hypothetical protein
MPRATLAAYTPSGERFVMVRRLPSSLAVMTTMWLTALTSAALVEPTRTAVQIASPSNDTIWLRTPAGQWDHAFPIGNGRLGAMVFGTVNRERIQLNEETLWMAAGATGQPEAPAALPDATAAFAGQPREAYALAERKMMARRRALESYQSLGDLRLIRSRRRDQRLPARADLDAAIVRVTYRVDGVRYTREVFASHPTRWSSSAERRQARRADLQHVDRSPAGRTHRLSARSPRPSRPPVWT